MEVNMIEKPQGVRKWVVWFFLLMGILTIVISILGVVLIVFIQEMQEFFSEVGFTDPTIFSTFADYFTTNFMHQEASLPRQRPFGLFVLWFGSGYLTTTLLLTYIRGGNKLFSIFGSKEADNESLVEYARSRVILILLSDIGNLPVPLDMENIIITLIWDSAMFFVLLPIILKTKQE
jgi:hypothetical protein